jgi:hypothetical protein
MLTRAGCEWRALPLWTNRLRPISTGVKDQSGGASGRQAGDRYDLERGFFGLDWRARVAVWIVTWRA